MMSGERTEGAAPPRAPVAGRSSRSPRAFTCGSAKTWATELISQAGTPAPSGAALRAAHLRRLSEMDSLFG
jgi:hypothetical protein